MSTHAKPKCIWEEFEAQGWYTSSLNRMYAHSEAPLPDFNFFVCVIGLQPDSDYPIFTHF